jgi:hypothetical protein
MGEGGGWDPLPPSGLLLLLLPPCSSPPRLETMQAAAQRSCSLSASHLRSARHPILRTASSSCSIRSALSAGPYPSQRRIASTYRASPRASAPAALSRRSAILAMASAAAAPQAGGDLLVVGPGVLGGYLGKLWKEAHPSSHVVGLTNTSAKHEMWESCMGLHKVTANLPPRMGLLTTVGPPILQAQIHGPRAYRQG